MCHMTHDMCHVSCVMTHVLHRNTSRNSVHNLSKIVQSAAKLQRFEDLNCGCGPLPWIPCNPCPGHRVGSYGYLNVDSQNSVAFRTTQSCQYLHMRWKNVGVTDSKKGDNDKEMACVTLHYITLATDTHTTEQIDECCAADTVLLSNLQQTTGHVSAC